MIAPVVDLTALGDAPGRLVVADVRWYLDGRSGRAAYDAGHLPGAVFVDLERCLSGEPGPGEGRHPLPDPAVFAGEMGRLGIGEGTTVVAYDDQGGIVASRLVWMLRALGHDAALLDGGLAAYDGPLETAPPAPPAPGLFAVRAWPVERFADLEEARRAPGLLLDARSPERYRGETEPVDARAGHIPGARSLCCADNLGPDGRFLPVDQLRRRFEAGGVAEAGDAVAYCGSGVSACHLLLALELAGLGRGRLYTGSFSQYAASPHPVATGPLPGGRAPGGADGPAGST